MTTPAHPAPGAKPTSNYTDAALLAAVKNAEQVAIAAGAPAATVIAAGAAAAKKSGRTFAATGPSSANSYASSVYSAILGGQGTSTLSQLTGSPVASFKTGAGIDKLGGWVGDLLRGLLPILKVGAGGAGLLVSGIALVYIAGRNVGADKAVKTALNPTRALAKKVAPGRAEAGRYASTERRRARTELARARVQPGRRGRMVVKSRREGREAIRTELAGREAQAAGRAERATDRVRSGERSIEGTKPRRKAPAVAGHGASR